MRCKILVLIAGIGFASMATSPAKAAGCLSGGAVGAVAGHVAGHHAVLGAVGGCIAGHEMKKHDRKIQKQANPQ